MIAAGAGYTEAVWPPASPRSSEPAVGVLLAVLSGAVILVALKEELPTEVEGRFSWSILGAAHYASLLFAT